MSDVPFTIPDATVKAVRDVVRAWLDGTTGGRYTNEVTRAVLSVPAVRAAFGAAADVEVYRTALGLACSDGWADGKGAMDGYLADAVARIAAERASS